MFGILAAFWFHQALFRSTRSKWRGLRAIVAYGPCETLNALSGIAHEPEPSEDSGAQSIGATEIQQESEDTEGSDAMVAPATKDQKKPWKRRPFGTLEDAMAVSAPLPIGATRRPRRKINNVALPKP